VRLLLAALFAALSLTGCANAGTSSLTAGGAPAAGGPAASAPFYLEWGTATPAVRVINGFTGRAEAVIAAPAGAGSFPWVGRTTWYPCGAAPDDRTFRYLAFQFISHPRDNDAGGVRALDTRSAATAALTASRLIISSERKLAGGISGVFNPVITPDGSKVVAAAWAGLNVAELAEFSARTGRLIAVLTAKAPMPGHGSPCQVLWTDPSGAHLIAYCGTPGVVNGTRFTPVHLHVPDTSGTVFTGVLLW
jgi:hypothetical protein